MKKAIRLYQSFYTYLSRIEYPSIINKNKIIHNSNEIWLSNYQRCIDGAVSIYKSASQSQNWEILMQLEFYRCTGYIYVTRTKYAL